MTPGLIILLRSDSDRKEFNKAALSERLLVFLDYLKGLFYDDGGVFCCEGEMKELGLEVKRVGIVAEGGLVRAECFEDNLGKEEKWDVVFLSLGREFPSQNLEEAVMALGNIERVHSVDSAVQQGMTDCLIIFIRKDFTRGFEERGKESIQKILSIFSNIGSVSFQTYEKTLAWSKEGKSLVLKPKG